MAKSIKKDILVHYHNEDFKLQHIGDKGKSNAIDLYTSEDLELEVGKFYLINLGVSIKLPDGYKADLKPRSSTFKKYGIIQTNSVGLIDSSYSGKDDVWLLPAYLPMQQQDVVDVLVEFLVKDKKFNISRKPHKIGEILDFRKVKIPKGTRLCQFEVFKVMEDFNIVESDLSEEQNRGGIGSTDE